MGRPNQTQDRLDALLDGRPGEVTDDLAPLLAAAEALRVELADFELDPEVVDRHIEQALDRPATVVALPVRKVGAGGGVLRRRLAAVGLAAALVLVPATAASAASSSALPGQALYPVKLAVEQFRLAAVQWSPTAEAQERAKIAAKRLAELDRLIKLEMYRQILPAIHALNEAVQAANVAVVEAAAQEGGASELVAAVSKLEAVKDAQLGELNEVTTIVSQLPPDNQMALTAAVQQSRVIAAAPPVLTPEPAPTVGPATTDPSGQPTPASEPSAPQSTAVPTTQPESGPPPTTAPPDPTTTDPTTTTGLPPTTVAPEGAQGSPAGAGDEGSPTSTTLP